MTGAFQRTGKSRADLVRLLAALPREERTAAARAIGFVREREAEPEIELLTFVPDSPVLGEKQAIATPEEAPAVAPIVQTPLWRFEKMTFQDEPEHPQPAREEVRGLTREDLHGTGQTLFATPKAPSLASWSRLWPRLRHVLHSSVPSREPDVTAWVNMVSRGETMTRIPRLLRRAWPDRLSIWVDRSKRLLPFWSDQVEVCHKLQKVCDRRGWSIRLLDARAQAASLRKRADFLAKFHADPATPILVLGDLGILGTDADRMAWHVTGLRLRRMDMRLSALVPSHPARWTLGLGRTWNVLAWEQGRSCRGMGLAQNTTTWPERAEQLLKWVSPAVYVQPGLLRAIRLLLPPGQVDASTEADVWNHAEVRAADVGGWMLQPEAATRYREAFAADANDALKERVSQTIAMWHGRLPRELLRAETLVWFTIAPEVKPPGDLQDALDFARRLEGSALAAGDDPLFANIVKRYGHALLAGMPEAIYKQIPALQTVWVASFQGVPVPRGIDPVAIRSKLERAGETRHWWVRQIGAKWVFGLNERGTEWPSYIEGPGSPLAWFEASRPWVTVVRGQTVEEHRLEPGLTLSFDLDEPVELRTDRCSVRLAPWTRESWTIAAGRDRFGLWADANISGVVQRFRWIPPGRFLMGSPESEAGRSDDEGPQHWVTWTGGRWFGDTPVTQGLWKAVTGNNPSYFQNSQVSTDAYPVEQVHWNACVAFGEKVGLRLPSEAEWEYACRGGTTTATWSGDLVILADYNAPVLDSIAWYGGNTEGGTNPVRQKEPNPFGLYDMLGNIYEWCHDAFYLYVNEAVVDPLPVDYLNAYSVSRGGSWRSLARRERAARRTVDPPDKFYDNIGCRLARGADSGNGNKGNR